MKKSILLLLFLALSLNVFGQRILLRTGFEGTTWGVDSLPPKWAKFKVNGPGACTWAVWAARDSGQVMCNTNALCNFLTKAYNSKRALNIPWTAATGSLIDDWVFTDSVRIVTGDSLIFWIQLGTYPCGTGTYYWDSCQVYVSTNQNPVGGTKTKLGTVISLPAATNVWQNIKYNLSSFSGQLLYVGFRYYMNSTIDAIMVNIDSVFVGNRAGPSIAIQNGSGLPKEFALSQNYPNPFNPSTTIEFALPKNEEVSITLFNMLGQSMRELVNGHYSAGYYKAEVNLGNLPSGIYIYRIKSGNFVKTMKMSLIK